MGGLSALCHSSSGRATAACVAAFVRSVPACCRVANGPSRPTSGELFLLSSCMGAAWLQARAACTGVGKLSAYWCYAGRAGLFF